MAAMLRGFGAVRGTGAAINVDQCGFRPTYVKLFNTSGTVTLEWTASMASAAGFKSLNHDTAQHAVLTSLGVTPYATGFTIGADTDVNVSGEDIHWIAFG